MISDIYFNFIIVIVWVVFLTYCIQECKRPKNFPDGPLLLPFIGSKWAVPAKGMENRISKWKKKYGNLVGHILFYKKMVVFCGSEEITEGLKHANFQGRYHSKFLMQRTHDKPLGLFFADDETWSEVRRFTIRYFGTIFTKELETILHDELLEDFSTIQSGEITEINGAFMKVPLNVVLKILTGTRRKDYKALIDDLQAKTEKAFHAGRITGVELMFPWFKVFFQNDVQLEAISAAQAFLKNRLDEHRKSFNPLNIKDYTDAFINEREKEIKLYGEVINFTDEEFLSCGIDLLQAGNESIGKTIEFVLMYIAMNLRIQVKLHEEIDRIIGQQRYATLNDRNNMPYLEATIHEILRMEPTAPVGVVHRVTEDTTFKGYFFEKDSLLMFALKYAMNDPEKWQNPEEFIPERFLNGDLSMKKLLSFGSGKRSCMAAVLTKNFMFLYLAYFFQRFSIKLPNGYKPRTDPILGFTNGPRPFKLIITKREDDEISRNTLL